MANSLRSPLDLLERVGLYANPAQEEALRNFEQAGETLHLVDTPELMASRVVGVAALWRLLLHPGSLAIVVASDRSKASDTMGFLYEITTKQDPALAAVCRWPRWSTLRIGDSHDYECRYVSNKPEFLHGLRNETTTLVVLGAGSSNPAFVETVKTAEYTFQGEGVRKIYVW